jgi:hypothetical protein
MVYVDHQAGDIIDYKNVSNRKYYSHTEALEEAKRLHRATKRNTYVLFTQRVVTEPEYPVEVHDCIAPPEKLTPTNSF